MQQRAIFAVVPTDAGALLLHPLPLLALLPLFPFLLLPVHRRRRRRRQDYSDWCFLGSSYSLRTTLSPFWIIDFTLLVDFPSLLSLRPTSPSLSPATLSSKRETNTFFFDTPVLADLSRPASRVTRLIIPCSFPMP
ncbi:hypothetical protein SODALDRAFT_55450 [Sodiomyces alkalinus F11]|uniref:Uncharacterized protein n=1 Tax=Sodiomyces alkalinus (strain CBS 110278 / VKM F-3762 / F11) TaxID=1314773 RepID=A0A3N2PNG4_SODAK|nr:hypothetical protein SODALDRAFT_55450 [Sodiomyces alkalinus F11]ROT35974.1 hypothetical protein SODALDRAFT_55450 [Sodiomyces alkalinus F11]